jgi:pimeloyl-ACP methyl ester carboxylesterase
MAKAKINDVEMYYEIHGSGRPLMMVAGLGSDSQSWRPVVEELSRSYRLILPDNRGAGRTTPQEIESGISRMADDCMALADHLRIEKFHLLGHSMGGFVSQDCAIRYPGRIEKLVLAATSSYSSERNKALLGDWADYLDVGLPSELWIRNLFYWIFTDKFFEDDSALDEAVQYTLEYPWPQSRTAFRRQTHALMKYDSRDSLSRIACETLALCGSEDMLFTPEASRHALAGIPRLHHKTIDGAAHSIHMEKPAEFIAEVKQFLG